MAQRQTIAHREEARPLIAGRLGPFRGEVRDIGLLLAALALARLAVFRRRPSRAGVDWTEAETRRAEQPYAA
jgi:hypothetical protein